MTRSRSFAIASESDGDIQQPFLLLNARTHTDLQTQNEQKNPGGNRGKLTEHINDSCTSGAGRQRQFIARRTFANLRGGVAIGTCRISRFSTAYADVPGLQLQAEARLQAARKASPMGDGHA